MDQLGITDRRRLRRKLTFWRAAAFVILVALVAGLAYFSGMTSTGTGGRGGDHIARVTVSGLITYNEDLIERIEAIRDNDAVKAMIVTIESPGGTTYGGERIYKAVRSVAEVKPVAAQVRGLAASAGYMVAAASDHIVAGEASIVGSIGVIFQYGNVSELLDNIGVSVDAVKSTPLKAEPSPFGPASPEAEAMIRRLVLDSYDWFTDLVTERRGFSEEKTLRLADGSIFTGRQALENGLIDALGAEDEIRSYFAERDVASGLNIIEWEEEGRGGLLFGTSVSEMMAATIRHLLPFDETFQRFTDDKLFLDGLLSVWHVEN